MGSFGPTIKSIALNPVSLASGGLCGTEGVALGEFPNTTEEAGVTRGDTEKVDTEGGAGENWPPWPKLLDPPASI